jgi:hypothetical protein
MVPCGQAGRSDPQAGGPHEHHDHGHEDQPGRRAAVHPDQREGAHPAEHAGDGAGDLHHQAGAVGDRLVGEQRDDHGRGDDRPDQPRRADLARRADVGGQHRGKHHAVNDHRFGKF